MKIKTKLISGVGLLFAFILLLAAMSIYYVNALKQDTSNILAANYNTLEYSRNMLLALEEIPKNREAIGVFEKNLTKQRANVTESGEEERTSDLASHFSMLKQNPNNSLLASSIRNDIAELMRLNMDAIERKSSVANKTAEEAVFRISVAGTLCFLIAFILLVNLPGNIANPIRELTESIRQIANQNYKQRVWFESNSEFGELARSFNTMAEKLEEYAESKLDKIIKGKKRIETLINQLHDPVIGIDENRKVLFANGEALKISGIKKEHFIGQQIQDVAVTNDLIRDLIKELINPEIGKTKELLKIFADGKESYFEKELIDIQVVPTGEQIPQLIGHVILLRNITPFKELDLAKTNFIGTVSHEFKTPISSIKMSLELLKNENIGALNSEQKELVEHIKDDADRLLKITGELLNLTQVESGNIQLSLRPTDPRGLVSQALDAVRTQAEQKNIKVIVNDSEQLSSVIADGEKTVSVLVNLISNAIRYSHEGGQVDVRISEDQTKITFSVTDHGTGIPEKYLTKVFDRYYRVPGTQKDGTGLGLAISKEFIVAQGGSLSVESITGSGSTFIFTLKKEVIQQ